MSRAGTRRSSKCPPLVLQQWISGDAHIYTLQDWQYLTDLQRALMSAATWGELEELAPANAFENLYTWRSKGGEHVYLKHGDILHGELDEDEDLSSEWVIDATDSFSPCDIPSFSDGDLPPWIDRIYQGIPAKLAAAFGTTADSRVSGSWTQYPMDSAEELVAALTGLGFEVRVVTELPW